MTWARYSSPVHTCPLTEERMSARFILPRKEQPGPHNELIGHSLKPSHTHASVHAVTQTHTWKTCQDQGGGKWVEESFQSQCGSTSYVLMTNMKLPADDSLLCPSPISISIAADHMFTLTPHSLTLSACGSSHFTNFSIPLKSRHRSL